MGSGCVTAHPQVVWCEISAVSHSGRISKHITGTHKLNWIPALGKGNAGFSQPSKCAGNFFCLEINTVISRSTACGDLFIDFAGLLV